MVGKRIQSLTAADSGFKVSLAMTIKLAILFQLLAIVFFIGALGNSRLQKQKNIAPGQVYEKLYEGWKDRPSSIYLNEVVAVKDGHVKYIVKGLQARETGYEEIETTDSFLFGKRLINTAPPKNPFTETQ